MRLIDADELKKCAIPCEIHNGALTDLCVPLYQIDNAPTVKPSLNLDDITEEDIKKFRMIWQRATSKGLLVINEERLQGEWEATNETDLFSGLVYKCTQCGKGVLGCDCHNFCTWCGADMKGGIECSQMKKQEMQ